MTKQAITAGVHHVGLTVPDVDETSRFFIDILGYHQVGEKPEYPAVFVSDGTVMVTIWQAAESATPFDRRTAVGLHHLALRVDGAELGALAERLEGCRDVSIDFPPEPLGGGTTRHMMCFIPGGVRVEFIATEAGR